MMTLIEVLISLFLLSIMLCGLALNQIQGMRTLNQNARQLIAIEQLNLIVSQLNLLTVYPSAAIIDAWQQQCRTRLANGHGRVTGRYPDYRIEITWGAAPHVCQTSQGASIRCLTYQMGS